MLKQISIHTVTEDSLKIHMSENMNSPELSNRHTVLLGTMIEIFNQIRSKERYRGRIVLTEILTLSITEQMEVSISKLLKFLQEWYSVYVQLSLFMHHE